MRKHIYRRCVQTMSKMKNFGILAFLAVFAIIFIGTGFSYSQYATLTDDVAVVNSSPTANFGGIGYIPVSATPVQRAYGYFQFDSSNIPSNAIITSASLIIYQNDKGTNVGNIVFQRVTDGTKISENSLTWYTQPTSDSTSQATLTATANGIYTLDVKDIVSYYFSMSRRDRIIFVSKPLTISNDNYRNIMSKEGYLSAEKAKLLITYDLPISISSVSISPNRTHYSSNIGQTFQISTVTNDLATCKFNDGVPSGATTSDKYTNAQYTMSGTSTGHTYNLPTLSNGAHTLYFSCKSTTTTPTYDSVILTINIDNTSPSTPTISSPSAGQSVTQGQSISLSYSVSDALSGIDSGSCVVSNTNGVNFSLSYSAGVCSGSITIPTSALGVKSLTTFVKDLAGNIASNTVSVNVSIASTTPTVYSANVHPAPQVLTASTYTMLTTCTNGCTPITTYWFIWDDGTVSSSATSSVSKTFYSTGNKQVLLIAENADGNSSPYSYGFTVAQATSSDKISINFKSANGNVYSGISDIPYPTPTKLQVTISPVSEASTYTCYSRWHCDNAGGICIPETITPTSGVFAFSNYYVPEVDTGFNPTFISPQRTASSGTLLTCTSPHYPTLTYTYTSDVFNSPYTKGNTIGNVSFIVETASGQYTGWNDIGVNVKPVISINRTYDGASIGNMSDVLGKSSPCYGTFAGTNLEFFYNPATQLYETSTWTTLNNVQSYSFAPTCSYNKIVGSNIAQYNPPSSLINYFTIGQSASNLEILFLDNTTDIRSVFTTQSLGRSEPFYIAVLYKTPTGELITPEIDSTSGCFLNFTYVPTATLLDSDIQMSTTNIGSFNTFAVYSGGEISGEGEYRADVFCSSNFYNNASASASMQYNETLYGEQSETFFTSAWVKVVNNKIVGTSQDANPPKVTSDDVVWFIATYGNYSTGGPAEDATCFASVVSKPGDISNISMPVAPVSDTGATTFYMKVPRAYFDTVTRYPSYFEWKIRCGAPGYISKSSGWQTLTITDPCPSCLKGGVTLVGNWNFGLRGIDPTIATFIPQSISYFNTFLTSITNFIKTYDEYLWVVAVVIVIASVVTLLGMFAGIVGMRKDGLK